MDFSQPLVWVAMLAAAAGTLGMLHILATSVNRVSRLHDLRVQAIKLRVLYLAQLKALDVGFDADQLPTHDQDALLRFLTTGELAGVEIGEEVDAGDGEEVIDVGTVASEKARRIAA